MWLSRVQRNSKLIQNFKYLFAARFLGARICLYKNVELVSCCYESKKHIFLNEIHLVDPAIPRLIEHRAMRNVNVLLLISFSIPGCEFQHLEKGQDDEQQNFHNDIIVVSRHP